MTPPRSALRAPRSEPELRRLASSHQWDEIAGDDVAALLVDDWTGAGPIHLEETLSIAELEAAGAVLLANARAVLRAAATEEMPEVSPGYVPEFRLELKRAVKVPDFSDAARAGFKSLFGGPHVHPLHWAQALLEVGGLLIHSPTGFTLSNRGRELLMRERAGELYAHLFRTFFRRFNLAYLDRFPELPELQDLVPHWLWVLAGPLGTTFTSADTYVHAVIPGPISARLGECAAPARLRHLIQGRVLDPLADFGLLQVNPGDDDAREMGDVGFRPTDLLRRFVRQDIPPPAVSGARRALRLLR